MILPELKLKQIIDSLLDYITVDYNNAPSEEDTFLYQVFNGNKLDSYDFYQQAKSILLRSSDDPRKLETRFMFDRDRAELPTIHIVLPSDRRGKDNTIGINRGGENHVRKDGIFQYIYTRSFDTSYQLAITSGNSLETILIYQAIRAILIAATDSLELNGLRTPDLSGGDLDINPDIMPNIFARSITIEVDYDLSVPSIVKQNVLNKLNFKGTQNGGN